MGLLSAADIISGIVNMVTVLDKNLNTLDRNLIGPVEKNRILYIEGSSYDFTIDNVESPDIIYGDMASGNCTFIGKDIRVTPRMEQLSPRTCFILKFITPDDKDINLVFKNRVGNHEIDRLKRVYGVDKHELTECDNIFVIEPNKFYLARSTQSVAIPLDIAMLLNPRTTMFRGGLAVHCSWGAPNYQGKLHVGINNLRDEPAFIELGARFISAHFFRIDLPPDIDRSIPNTMVHYTHPYGCGDECASAWQGGIGTSDGSALKAY